LFLSVGFLCFVLLRSEKDEEIKKVCLFVCLFVSFFPFKTSKEEWRQRGKKSKREVGKEADRVGVVVLKRGGKGSLIFNLPARALTRTFTETVSQS